MALRITVNNHITKFMDIHRKQSELLSLDLTASDREKVMQHQSIISMQAEAGIAAVKNPFK